MKSTEKYQWDTSHLARDDRHWTYKDTRSPIGDQLHPDWTGHVDRYAFAEVGEREYLAAFTDTGGYETWFEDLGTFDSLAKAKRAVEGELERRVREFAEAVPDVYQSWVESVTPRSAVGA